MALDAVSTEDAKTKVSDVKVFGNPDIWQLICKASSEKEGWMKSTKVMKVEGGLFLQVTTKQRNPDGSWAISESVTFAPKA